MTDGELTHAIIGAAIEVHRQLGPGLLESAYEECLARELTLRSVSIERQKALPVVYKGVKLDCGYRLDLLAGGRVIVEPKAVDALAPIHDAILLTYLRLSGCRIGLLINFNCATLKDGIRRRVLNYKPNEEPYRGDAVDAEEKPRCQTAESES
jgi:GxxExxY protein